MSELLQAAKLFALEIQESLWKEMDDVEGVPQKGLKMCCPPAPFMEASMKYFSRQ